MIHDSLAVERDSKSDIYTLPRRIERKSDFRAEEGEDENLLKILINDEAFDDFLFSSLNVEIK